ncbi:hypothetical protein ACOCJ4_05150 [Knoellia sp. CPCC 206435]|uniref:hypothetical protein n=1 Tax=Knoellia terrae TaxID=3404797 RepID=UPI003B42AC39
MTGRAPSPESGVAPTWVLLEGTSDVAAVRALRTARGVRPDSEPCRLVDMGGATNIRRHLQAAATAHPRPRVIGLCDEREAAFFVRALDVVTPLHLDSVERPISVDDLPALGFQICRRDLEDELLRALGADGALAVLGDVGLRDAFAAFTRQPAWQGRPVLDQLHRFCGTTSGRKELLAGALARALDEGSSPPPLAALLASMPSP